MKKLITITAICLLLGAILWNGWVFGWLNHASAGYLHMSISELEVRGQPRAFIFESLDFISGIFMVLGAFGLMIITKARPLLLGLIAVCIFFVGALTLFDVSHPLDCNTFNNIVCVRKIESNHVSTTNMLHNEEGTVTAYLTVLMILFTVIWVYLTGQSKFRLNSALIAFFGIFITLGILATSGNVMAGAISERIWNVLVSINIGFIAFILFREEHRHPHIRKLNFNVRSK